MPLAAGVLARHQPEEGHQRAGRAEATEVMQLRQDQHGRQRVDAAETPEPADGLAIRRLLGELRQARVQFLADGPPCDRSPADNPPPRPAPRCATRSGCPPSADGPASNSCPRSAARAATATCPGDGDTAARSSRASSRARASHAPPRRPASAAARPSAGPRAPSSASFRASRRFVFTRSPGLRGINAGAITSQRHARPSSSAAAARTHTGRLRRRPPPAPARRARACAPCRRTAPGSLASCHVIGVAASPTQHRDKEILLVRIDADVRSNLFHDRLLSVRLWRRKALTRDIGGHRPPCRVRQHYDATIAGRSFHIV